MDPEAVLKAIEGYQDELYTEKKGLDAFYRQFRCKRKECGGQVRKLTDPRHCFADPETIVARALLECVTCGLTFDPHTGIILERGDADRILGVPVIGRK